MGGLRDMRFFLSYLGRREFFLDFLIRDMKRPT
jgi:hypothetical protein